MAKETEKLMATLADVPALIEAIRSDPTGFLLRLGRTQGPAAVTALLGYLAPYLPGDLLAVAAPATGKAPHIAGSQGLKHAHPIPSIVSITAMMGAISVLGVASMVATSRRTILPR